MKKEIAKALRLPVQDVGAIISEYWVIVRDASLSGHGLFSHLALFDFNVRVNSFHQALISKLREKVRYIFLKPNVSDKYIEMLADFMAFCDMAILDYEFHLRTYEEHNGNLKRRLILSYGKISILVEYLKVLDVVCGMAHHRKPRPMWGDRVSPRGVWKLPEYALPLNYTSFRLTHISNEAMRKVRMYFSREDLLQLIEVSNRVMVDPTYFNLEELLTFKVRTQRV